MMPSKSSSEPSLYQSWYDEKRVALSSSIDNTIKQLKEAQSANSQWPLHYPALADQAAPDSPRDENGTQIPAREPQVLRLDLKFGAQRHDEFVRKLGKDTIASVLEDKMGSCMRQLSALRDRINDPLSKILVTGDVNAGKSTFCNALLRRQILPHDQQPCTAIFCEVQHAKQNSGHEEVHAITPEASTDVFALKDLEDVVTDAQYTQCKVYVDDLRSSQESLLSADKEVVDIAIIDAPGLNHDTTHTTAVFARQEEIDVVVFVVSATNHFTISAKDFIRAATAEKSYLFIVVNAFDTIEKKERCKKGIMDQIRILSPQTYEESTDLVHFVSSNAVLTPKDQIDDVIQQRIGDFENLERSLRKFVLEKRARSKLAPARTYLLNVLNDINLLASTTVEATQAELERASEVVDGIVPQLESRRKEVDQVRTEMDTTIQNTCMEVFDQSRSAISGAITHAGDSGETYDVRYEGPFSAFQYAEDLQAAMLSRIAETVAKCEDDARRHVVTGVNTITQLGIMHSGKKESFEKLQFRPEVMFTHRRDALARQIDISIDVGDFVEWPTLMWTEKFASASMAVTVATAVGGHLTTSGGWLAPAMRLASILENSNMLRRLVIPGVLVAVIGATVAHVLQEIPRVVPKHVAAKVAAQLEEIDFVHANASRITERVRRVLRIPAEDVRIMMDRSIRDIEQKREQMDKVRNESQVALKYFRNLVKRSAAEVETVQDIGLEGGVDE